MKCSHRRRRATTELLIYSCVAILGCFGLAQRAAAQEAPPDAQAPADTEPRTDTATSATGTVLDDFVREVRDLTAEFVQRRFDADGELFEVSTGRMALLRPNRFLWQAETPFEETVVTDGELLWRYDVELEQASRRPFADFAASPAMLLSGESDIDAHYRVAEVGTIEGLRWIELAPRDGAASEFMSAKIGFRGSVPVALEFVDGLAELTRIDFENIALNAGLDPGRFDFEPPPGVDVVDD